MSQRFHRNVKTLHKLHKSNAKQQQFMIKNESDDLIGSLCDCALNIRTGKIPLTTKQFKKLKSHHKDITALTRKTKSTKSKRRVLQKGGFLGAILGPIAQLLFGGLGRK